MRSSGSLFCLELSAQKADYSERTTKTKRREEGEGGSHGEESRVARGRSRGIIEEEKERERERAPQYQPLGSALLALRVTLWARVGS